jgi:hypothetical protein
LVQYSSGAGYGCGFLEVGSRSSQKSSRSPLLKTEMGPYILKKRAAIFPTCKKPNSWKIIAVTLQYKSPSAQKNETK